MKNSAIELGKSLGKSSVEIMKGMAEFGRITKEPESIKELTRIATMASNVTEMTAQESAKAITTAMVTFGVEAKDAMSILDSWNSIQNNFRVSATDMADSISKIGAASKVAKTDMTTLEGIISSIIQSTGIDGTEAGTAVKSFISRIYRTNESDPEELAKTAKALKEIVNIDVSKNGQLLSFGEIVSTIASKWKNLSEQEQMTVAQQIGSTYHYSKFIALMQNYNIALDATEKAINSQGSAMRENQKYLDSISGRWEILGTTWEEFENSVLSSSVFKILISGFTMLINGLNTVPGKISLVVSTVALLGMAFVTFRTQISTATLAVKGFFASLGPIGWITLAISTLTPVVMGIAGAFEQSSQKAKEVTEAYKQQQSEVTSLISTYKQNAELAKIDKNAKSQLIETEKTLKGIFGESANGLDLQNGKIDDNIQKIKELMIQKQKEFIQQQQINADKAKEYLDSSDTFKAGSWMGNVAEFNGKPEEALAYFKQLRDEMLNLNNNFPKGSGFLGDLSKSDNARKVEELNEAIKNLESQIDGYKSTLSSVDDAHKIVVQDSMEGLDKLSEKQKEVYDNVKDKLSFTNEEQYKKNLQDVVDAISKWDGKNIDDLNIALQKVDSTLPGISSNAKQTSNNIDSMSFSVEEYIKEQKKAADEIEAYNNLLAKLNNGHQITGKEIADLVEKYPVFNKVLEVHNGILEVNKQKLLELKDATVNNAQTTINAEINKTKTTIEMTMARIKAYETESSYLSKKYAENLNRIPTTTLEEKEQERQMHFLTVYKGKATEAKNELADLQTYLGKLEALKSTIGASNFGVTKEASTPVKEKKADEPDSSLDSYYDSLIRLTRQQAELTQTKIDSINADIEQAKKAEDNNLVLQKTNELLIQQKLKTDQLNASSKELKWEFAHQAERSGFDTTNWLDANGEATVEYNRQYLASSKSVQESMAETFSILQKLKKAWLENDTAIKEMINSQQDLAKTIEDLRGEMADSIIEAIKSAYEMQKEIAIKALEDEMDAEERRHNRKMQNLDNELKKIQRQHESEDYGKNLSKAQQEALDIQKQIDILALDNSIEAKVKREELMKQLAEKNEEIAEMQNDREYDLRTENIEDQKEAEDKKYETKKSSLEQQIKDAEYFYDELINDEVKYANMREDIIDGSVDNIKAKLQEFLDAFAQMNAETAGQIGLSWSALTQTIETVNTASGTATKASKPTVYVRSGSKDGAILQAQYGGQIKVVTDDSKVDPNLIGADRYATNAKYQQLLKQYGLTATDVGDLWKFASGGLTENTGLHWLDGKKGKPEGILSPEQTTSWIKLVDNLTNIIPITDILKKLVNINPLQSIMSSFQPMDLSKLKLEFAGGSPITIQNEVNFNVNGTSELTTKQMDKIASYINTKTVNGLKKIGKR